MKHMGFPYAVNKLNGIEFEMLKIVQTIRLGNLDIEVSAANLAGTLPNRTAADDIVARCDFVEVGTADLLRSSELGVIHSS
jgi:hypothetical protein